MSTSLKGISASYSSKSDYQFPPKPDEYGDIKPPPRRLDVHSAFRASTGTRSAPTITLGAKEHKMDWGRVDTELGPDVSRAEDAVKESAPSYTANGRSANNVLVTNEWVPGPGTYNSSQATLTSSHPTLHQDGRGWGFSSSLRPQPRGNDTPAPFALPELSKNNSWSMTSKSDVGSMFNRKSGLTPGPGAYEPSLGGKSRQMPRHTFGRSTTREAPIVGFKKESQDDPGPGAYRAHLGRGDVRRPLGAKFGVRGNRFAKAPPQREY